MTRRSRFLALAALLAGVVGYVLRAVLAPGLQRLPGTDSLNLFTLEMYNRAVLLSGRLPFWDPYMFGGTPHMADTQTTVLYPVAAMLRLLPPFAFLPWMIAAHLWIAGTGTLYLARTVRLHWTTATAAALATMLGGSVAPWIYNGHLLLLYCAAWMPWALAFSITSVRRNSIAPDPRLVVVLVLQFLAGNGQSSIYLTGAVSLYFLYSVVWPESTTASRWRPLAQLMVLAVLAMGLVAFQLLPMARLAAEAGRTAGLPYSTAVAAGWRLADLASFFFPHRYASDRGAYVGWLLAILAPAAVLDRERRRLVVFFGILLLCAVVVTLGHTLPVYRWHHALFPGFRVPGRILFIAVPGLTMCGAIGIERCASLARERRWRELLAGIGTGVLAAIAAVVVVRSGIQADAVSHDAWALLPLVVAAGIAVMMTLAAAGWSRAALSLALVLVAVDLLPHVSRSTATIPVTPPDAIRQWIGPADGGRVLSLCEHVVGTNELVLSRNPALTGTGAVYLRDFAAWASLASNEGPFPARRDLWDASNVTRVVSCEPVNAPALSLVSHDGPVYVYRNDSAWPRAVWTCDLERLTSWEVAERLREARYNAARQLVRREAVNIRWSSRVSDQDRRDLEERYGLLEGELREGTTWRYRLRDSSVAKISAMLRDPAVEDTSGIDRHTGVLSAPPKDDASAVRADTLLGTARCATSGTVAVLDRDRPDGRVTAEADAPTSGYVFFSEPYYAERRAFVDGQPAVALRANLGLTAVAVPAGHHRVELRMVPKTFYIGLVIAGVTICAWGSVMLVGRRRGAARVRPPSAHV